MVDLACSTSPLLATVGRVGTFTLDGYNDTDRVDGSSSSRLLGFPTPSVALMNIKMATAATISAPIPTIMSSVRVMAIAIHHFMAHVNI